MNRLYWKFAGTIVCGSTALFALSGCWSREPAATQQTQPGATISEQHLAPVDNSTSKWQPAERPVVCEPSRSQARHITRVQPQTTQSWQGESVYVEHANSASYWQQGLNPSVTPGPAPSPVYGWTPGYYNPNVTQEAAGANWQDNRQYNSGNSRQNQYQQQQYQSKPSGQSNRSTQPKSQCQKLESPRQSTGSPGSSEPQLHDQQTPSDN